MTGPRRGRPPAIDSSTPIFVLRLSLGAFQHGVLSVARSAGRLGVPVYAVRSDSREPATRSRYIKGALELGGFASDADRLAAIAGLADRVGRCVLVPIDDRAAVFVADHSETLSPRFMFSQPPAGLARELASKRRLWELCVEHGIPAPVPAFPAHA